MTIKKLDKQHYEVITQEDKDTGDMIIPLPQPLLDQLGWKEDDNIQINIDKNGKLILKKA